MNYLNCTPSPRYKSTALILAASRLDVRAPNGAVISSTHTAMLDIPSSPMAAIQAHILPGLAQLSILSVCQMCDSG
jgi:hypothetical protein